MKKKQHPARAIRMTTKPRIGRATTTPRFTPGEALADGVVRDMLDGRRTSVKILEGEMSKISPVTVLK